LYGVNFSTLDSKTQFTKVLALLTNCIRENPGVMIMFSLVPALHVFANVVTLVKVAVFLIQGV